MAGITVRRATRALAGALLFALAPGAGALAQDEACVRCHKEYGGRKFVHAAMEKGCASCHPGVDATRVPHRPKDAPRDAAASAAACHECHERKAFEGRFAHAPVEGGSCIVCHDPHASDYPALGRKPGAALCLDCHAEVARRPHVMTNFSGKGHPVGTAPRPVQDPLRAGKTFYCGSCHDPHRGDFPRLMRFDVRSMSVFCLTCHKM